MILCILFYLPVSDSCTRKKDKEMNVKWSEAPPLPSVAGKGEQPGLAGPVSGAFGKYLMVAGGANFEDKMPWQGGTKSYHDEIFLLKEDPIDMWQPVAEKLPFPLAYPACLTLPEGIISIGGEDPEGPVADVFRFSVVDGKVRPEILPSLPVPLSSAAAAFSRGKIYVAGGLDRSGATAHFFSLALGDLRSGWQELPDLPLPLSHCVVAIQNDGYEECFYLMGGRNKTSEVHTFFSTVWKYIPSSAKWVREGDILSEGKPLTLSAGTGIAAGSGRILLFGGDPGIWFNRTERLNNAVAAAKDSEKPGLLAEKDSLLTNHPGFSRKVLVYDTRAKTWRDLPLAGKPLPVTTVAFYWGNRVVIPSGEIRPGVRTPGILLAEIK